MRQLLSSIVLLLLSINSSSVFAAQAVDAALEVDPQRLKAHIEFLASDELRGRAAGSREYDIAARYVASQFQQLGLQPAGNDSGYFQEVPLLERRLVDGSAAVTVHSDGKAIALSPGDDFLMSPASVGSSQSVSANAVFVGYGIVAPTFDHDDYAGVDLEGKIAVMLAGRPEAWPTEEGAHFASGSEKARHAADHGAVGIVVIATPRQFETFSWDIIRYYYGFPSMSWVDEAGIPDGYLPEIQGGAVINASVAAALFQNTPRSVEEIFEADSAGSAIEGFPLTVKLSLERSSSYESLSSPNVIASIPGSDPGLRDEYLVFTAHLDHIGVDEDAEEGEDSVFNGALDNAAGVAMLLETARVLNAERDQLRRSVLFLVVTAEEQGLLGAGYFAKQPTVPINQIVANVNLDMPVALYPFANMVAFGAEHSSLKGSVARAAAAADVELSPDPAPEQGYFTRSDHYQLVQEGVPAVALDIGYQSRDPSIDGEAMAKKFTETHYHQPSDDPSLPINYQAAALFTHININIAREVCNDSKRPYWNAGDFFGETFGPERVARGE